jgi:hypothetical protein
MTTSEPSNGLASVLFKTAASLVTVTGFIAAAVFFVAFLWRPVNAAPSTTTMDVQPSLLLALDKPQPSAPKPQLPLLPSLADEERETAVVASSELVTELNNWTYTQSNLANQVFSFAIAQAQIWQRFQGQAFYAQNALLLNRALLFQTILNDFGISSPFLLSWYIGVLRYEQNLLSPYR